MIRLFLPIFLLATIASSNPLLAFENEPNGFRGIKWGTDISTLKDLKHIRDDHEGSVKYYKKEGEELKIGEAELESIEYGFWRGKLATVTVHTEGVFNYDKLITACKTKFGEPEQPDKKEATFVWRGKVTKMALGHDDSFNGSLIFFATRYFDQIMAYTKQKKQEKVEGF